MLVKTKNAETLGQYKATQLDNEKVNADFLLLQTSPFYIQWASGVKEIVTAAKLAKLQKSHSWATNF